MRLAGDVGGTKKAVTDILQLCFEARAWKTLNDQILVLSKRRGQLKQVLVFQLLTVSIQFKLLVTVDEELGIMHDFPVFILCNYVLIVELYLGPWLDAFFFFFSLILNCLHKFVTTVMFMHMLVVSVYARKKMNFYL